MKKMIIAILSLVAVSGFSAFAEEPKHEKHEHKTFEQVDADKDGKISLAEFKAAYEKLPADKAEEIFKHKDKNSDGSLSPEEYNTHGDHKGGDHKDASK